MERASRRLKLVWVGLMSAAPRWPPKSTMRGSHERLHSARLMSMLTTRTPACMSVSTSCRRKWRNGDNSNWSSDAPGRVAGDRGVPDRDDHAPERGDDRDPGRGPVSRGADMSGRIALPLDIKTETRVRLRLAVPGRTLREATVSLKPGVTYSLEDVFSGGETPTPSPSPTPGVEISGDGDTAIVTGVVSGDGDTIVIGG
nr:MAG TPA: hypothetical protein [Caudoviricetes sp.]